MLFTILIQFRYHIRTLTNPKSKLPNHTIWFFSISFLCLFGLFFNCWAPIMKTIPDLIFKPYFTQLYLYICQSFGINMAFVFVRSQKNANTQHIVRFNKAKKAVCEMESKSNCRISVKRQRIYCYGIMLFIRSISLFSNDSLLLT